MIFAWKKLASIRGQGPARSTARHPKRMAFSWDNLEERKVLSHMSAAHHVTATAAHVASTSTTGSTGSNSTLTTARETLKTEVQTIEAASGTTVGELTAIRTTFATLKADGLKASSQSALTSFENSLVTSFAGGTNLTGNTTLLAQFSALYAGTTAPTTQQTTDLTAAYGALASAVTSSGITSADLTAIDTDYAAVLAAESSTSTASYPYFSLVTGGQSGGHGGPVGAGGFGCH